MPQCDDGRIGGGFGFRRAALRFLHHKKASTPMMATAANIPITMPAMAPPPRPSLPFGAGAGVGAWVWVAAADVFALVGVLEADGDEVVDVVVVDINGVEEVDVVDVVRAALLLLLLLELELEPFCRTSNLGPCVGIAVGPAVLTAVVPGFTDGSALASRQPKRSR